MLIIGMNRRKIELIKLSEYYTYLKSFGNDLEDIETVLKYCNNMIKNNSIPLKFVMDRETDAEYYYSILNAKFPHKVVTYVEWTKENKKKLKQR